MPTAYDEVDYGGNAHALTAPNRLAGMSRILGVAAADPQRARVLELACGNGANLIPLARHWPQANFVGVDLAATAVARGNARIAALGMRNIELRTADISALDASSLGRFDFVIAHGLFSWVPEAVRQATLRVMSGVLAPDGVGYVSYNALPGCRVRHVIRDLLRWQLRASPYSQEIVQPAWRFLESIGTVPAEGAPAFFDLLRREAENAMSVSPNFLFHDDLSPDNLPLYLHEFAAMAQAHGLAYVGDADAETMFEPDGATELGRWLDSCSGGDWLVRQQLLDFANGCRFRRSLVCHAQALRRPGIDPAAVQRSLWYSDLWPIGSVRLDDDSEARFAGTASKGISTNHPLIKAALVLIHSSPSRTIGTADFAERLSMRGDDTPEARLRAAADVLLRVMRSDLIAPVAQPCPGVIEAVVDGAHLPALAPLARMSLADGRPMVDSAHQNVQLAEPWMNEAVLALDGTAAMGDVVALVERRRADPEAGALPPTAQVRDAIEGVVRMLGRRGLLLPPEPDRAPPDPAGAPTQPAQAPGP